MQEIIVKLSGNDYARCDEFSKNMWANEKRPSYYNNGFLNSKADPRKTERIGCLGEMAFALYVGAQPDFEYVKFGKKYDFEINGLKIDVKTAARKPPYEATLIMCMNERGNYIPLHCDIYISAYVTQETVGECAEICLVGWHRKSDIIEQLPAKARRNNATHMNYELRFHEALPLSLLKEKL